MGKRIRQRADCARSCLIHAMTTGHGLLRLILAMTTGHGLLRLILAMTTGHGLLRLKRSTGAFAPAWRRGRLEEI